MYFLGLVILTIARGLKMILDLYTIIMVISIVLSWVKPDPYNPLVRFISQVTYPVFSRVRRMLPSSFFKFGIDPSPIIVFLAIMAFDTMVITLLFDLARKLTAQ